MFGPDEIKAEIKRQLDTDITIPDENRGALVTFINTDKAEIALATKINNNWRVELIASHEWTGDNQVGAISKVTW